MDANEVHIKFLQDSERINAYVHEDLEKNEIDLVLNSMQQRFIDERVRRSPRTGSKFQLEQPDFDDLEYIITRDFEIPLIIDENRSVGYAELPDNYMYLLNDRTRLASICNNTPIQKEVRESYSVVIPLSESNKESSPFYSVFSLTLEGVVSFSISNFPSYYSSGLPDKSQIFEVKNLLIDHLRDNLPDKVLNVYWERYDNNYYPYSIILELSEPLNPNLENSLNIDDTSIELSTRIFTDLEYVSSEYKKEVPNRFIKTEHIYTTLHNNSFTGTSIREPISTIAKNKIFVYFDKKFKPKSIIIDYIRIPRKFNIFLNQTFEIKEVFHSRIVDLAVEYFKNTTEKASAYELKLKDNELRRE